MNKPQNTASLVHPFPQHVETVQWARTLRVLDRKLRSGRACRQAEACAAWIETELHRRARAACASVGIEYEAAPRTAAEGGQR